MIARTQLTADFYEDELRCRCGCGLLTLQPGFKERLQELREVLHLPINITGPGRCKAHNAAIGGHPKSLHIMDEPQHPGQLGMAAVDVGATDGSYRGKLFVAAWSLGWSIGWNAKKGFLHIDRRTDLGLPQTSFDY